MNSKERIHAQYIYMYKFEKNKIKKIKNFYIS
jgi:hypothetical protein